MNTTAEFLAAITSFTGKRILVIGDLLLDIYLKGKSSRLCPEAPVPVVDVEERIIMPGGAANTACNLSALGARVDYCTVIGADHEGQEAVALLRQWGVDDSNIIRNKERKTITKSRVVAGAQVITRIDQGSDAPIDAVTTRTLIARIEKVYRHCDAIILSDYDKGIITAPLLERLIQLQYSHRKFTAIDSKRLPFFARLRPSCAKPNYEEVRQLLALPALVGDRVHQVSQVADALFRATNAGLITVTLDKDGSVVIRKGKVLQAVPAPPVRHAYVAGAGDSYLSAFVLSHLSTGDACISARIATAAADVSVRKEFTATCTQAELRTHFNVQSKIIADLNGLKEVCDGYHASGKRIVFTNGCFDILHSGHVTYLRRAKELGDILIVGLNTDESIKRIKGPSRPINTLSDRLQVLAGLSSVDHIVPFGANEDDTPAPVINVVRPHFFAKGGDYTREQLPEASTVERCGGEIVFLDHVPDHSTTLIINRISRASDVSSQSIRVSQYEGMEGM